MIADFVRTFHSVSATGREAGEVRRELLRVASYFMPAARVASVFDVSLSRAKDAKTFILAKRCVHDLSSASKWQRGGGGGGDGCGREDSQQEGGSAGAFCRRCCVLCVVCCVFVCCVFVCCVLCVVIVTACCRVVMYACGQLRM